MHLKHETPKYFSIFFVFLFATLFCLIYMRERENHVWQVTSARVFCIIWIFYFHKTIEILFFSFSFWLQRSSLSRSNINLTKGIFVVVKALKEANSESNSKLTRTLLIFQTMSRALIQPLSHQLSCIKP